MGGEKWGCMVLYEIDKRRCSLAFDLSMKVVVFVLIHKEMSRKWKEYFANT